MKKIANLLIAELKSDRLISLDFIKAYIDDYIAKNHLSRYYKGLETTVPDYMIKNNLICGYNSKTKKLHINDDLMISSIIDNSYLKDKETFDNEDYLYIFALYLDYITHELTHIKQYKKIHSFSNDVEVDILKDSFNVHDKYYEFYLANHDIFPSEKNAHIEALFTVYKLFYDIGCSKYKEFNRNFNIFASNVILEHYEDLGEVMLCPTKLFYDNFKEKNKFYVLDKKMSKNNFVRISYGMPFDYELFSKLKDVQEEKTNANVKKLVLGSNNYGKNI